MKNESDDDEAVTQSMKVHSLSQAMRNYPTSIQT